jgi:WD40 repeat protein
MGTSILTSFLDPVIAPSGESRFFLLILSLTLNSHFCSIWAYPLGTLIRVFTGHKLEITSLAICSDAENLSPVIISGSCDKTIRLWSFNTGEEFRRLEIPHDRPSAAGDINTVNIALPNQSSQFNLIGSNDNGIVTVWDMTMMIRGLSPLPDDIFLDFMRDCKGQRSQSSLETLSSAWPRMLELFDRYGSHEILFQNPRIFSVAVLWDKPSFIRHFLHHCPDAVTNCQWSSYTRENCSDLEYEHINERQTNYRTYWKNFLEIDTLGTDATTAALAAEVQSKEHPFVTQSLLFFAMVCQSKSAVEAVTEAMTSILLIPPIDSPYSMYHHLSRTIPSSDLALLAHNYPLIFQSFITALKPIEANFLVFDLTLNPDPKFYIDPDVTALHSGTETPAADRGLWPRFAERKMMKAIEQKKKRGKGDSLNASALMPMFIPLPNTASLLFLRSVLQVCETLEDSSLFHASVVHFSLRFIWQKIGLRVHVWLMKEYIVFVFLYSAACSQFGTEYFGSSIDISISIFLHSLLLILVLQLTVQEYIQFSYSNFWDHLRDFWNLIDITNIVVCVGGAVLRAAYQRETSLSRICFAVGFLTVYGRLLYFLRAFKSVGPLGTSLLRPRHPHSVSLTRLL